MLIIWCFKICSANVVLHQNVSRSVSGEALLLTLCVCVKLEGWPGVWSRKCYNPEITFYNDDILKWQK